MLWVSELHDTVAVGCVSLMLVSNDLSCFMCVYVCVCIGDGWYSRFMSRQQLLFFPRGVPSVIHSGSRWDRSEAWRFQYICSLCFCIVVRAGFMDQRPDMEAMFVDDDFEALIHSSLHCAAAAVSPSDASTAIRLLDGLVLLPSISANEDAKSELRAAARRLADVSRPTPASLEPPRMCLTVGLVPCMLYRCLRVCI